MRTEKRSRADLPPIAREPGESSEWYSRFCSFCLAGPRRSALAVYKSQRPDKARKSPTGLPGSWKIALEKFDWKTRATAFDAAVIEQDKQRFSEDREAERKKRFAVLKRLRRKINEALLLCNPLGTPLSAIANAVRVFCEMSRAEEEVFDILERLDRIEARQAGKSGGYSTDDYSAAMRRKFAGDDQEGEPDADETN